MTEEEQKQKERILKVIPEEENFGFVDKNLISSIYNYLSENNLSKNEFAQKIGITPVTLSRILHGQTKTIRPSTWGAMRKILKLKHAKIIDKNEIEKGRALETIQRIYMVFSLGKKDFTAEECLKVIYFLVCQHKGLGCCSLSPNETRLLADVTSSYSRSYKVCEDILLDMEFEDDPIYIHLNEDNENEQ